jgi:hypothetical protein
MSEASHQNAIRNNSKGNSGKVREKLYIPRVMAETMLAATANSTSVHFGFNHMCRKHNALFTMEHVEQCDEITGCSNIRRFAKKLKERNIRDWDVEERR